MSRLPHFLDIRLTDGSEIVSHTPRPPFLPPGRFLVLISVKRLSRLQGHSAAGRIRSNEKSKDLIGNRSRCFPASSIVSQPTTLPYAPVSRQDCDEIVFSGYYNEVSEHCRHETSFSVARRPDIAVVASNFSSESPRRNSLYNLIENMFKLVSFFPRFL
jgi:hypothetical protein